MMHDPDPTQPPSPTRKEREKARIRARREQRVTYDLPPLLRQWIKALAEEQRLPASQLVTLALLRFLKQFEAGEIDLGRYKQPSRSPRYDWNLVFPTDLLAAVKTRPRGRKT